jgi:hypothetical protein
MAKDVGTITRYLTYMIQNNGQEIIYLEFDRNQTEERALTLDKCSKSYPKKTTCSN